MDVLLCRGDYYSHDPDENGNYQLDFRVDRWGFDKNGKLCRDHELISQREFLYLTDMRFGYWLSPHGIEFANKVRDILVKRINNPDSTISKTKTVNDIKSDFYLITAAVRQYYGFTENELYSAVPGGCECFFKNTFDKQPKYGIITGPGKVIFRKREGNKKAGTFDFVSVDYPLVAKTNEELCESIKKNQKSIMNDALNDMQKYAAFRNNELLIKFIRPYAMTLTQDKLIHIDFELKEVL